MKLFLVRHGATNYNLLSLCNDDPTDAVYLTPEGIVQAQAAGQKLKKKPLEGIFSSPLPRALQTAEIINRHHNLPITTLPCIRDIRSGFNGKPVRDYFAAIAHAPLTATPPGGESLRDYQAMVLHCVENLSTMKARMILAVAHEETLRMVYAHAHGVGDAQLRDLHFDNGQILEFDLPF